MPDDKIAAYEIEAHLLRWGDSSAAGRTITLELDPDAGETHPFKGYRVGKTSGQRFKMLFIPIGDDEAPQPPPAPPEAPARSPKQEAASERGKAAFRALPDMKKDVVKAAMMIKDVTFQGWILGAAFKAVDPSWRDAATNEEMKRRLYITSKAEIGEDREVNDRWRTLLTTYERDTNQLAEIRS